MRIAQAIDVIEAQPLQLALRDQTAHEAMDGGKCGGILHPQSSEAVDVEEAAVVDFAAREPPMSEAIILPLEQAMQMQHRRGPAGSPAIGLEPTLDNRRTIHDLGQLGLQGGRGRARGGVRAAMARGQFQELPAGGLIVGGRLQHNFLQDLAVAVWADRQSVFVVPGGEAPFRRVVAQCDLAGFQGLAVGAPENRDEHAAARMPLQALPIDIE